MNIKKKPDSFLNFEKNMQVVSPYKALLLHEVSITVVSVLLLFFKYFSSMFLSQVLPPPPKKNEIKLLFKR